MTIRVLAETGQNHVQIRRTVGVSESTVRYHLRRAAQGAEDDRRDKPERVATRSVAIVAWHAERRHEARPINVMELYEHLVAESGYSGSYQSVRRFVQRHYPTPQMRTYRRVETVPGAQSQMDWAEYPRVDVGEGPEPLSAFAMRLSHSRKPAVVWSRSRDLLAWLSCHNGAFERLAGITAINRVDNVKTTLASGAGPWGTIHPAYRAYAQTVGFLIDACLPRAPEAKGKAEAAMRLARLRLDPGRRRFDSLEALQA